MPEGTFRRPPQLWEQKIANMVAVNSVGSVSGGGTEEVGADMPPGNGGPAPEAPVIAPTPTAFGTPSTPTLTGGVQSIMVTWDGLNSSGDLYPYENAVVEIHLSTSTGFTPDATTLKGELRYPGSYTLTGLTAGTTYYVKLRGRDGQGNYSSASTQASGTTGLTTTNDYGTGTIDAGAVSFNARAIGGITTTVGTTAPTSPVTGDIWLDSTGGAITHKRWDGSSWVTQAWGSSSLSANCITATQIAAGAVTAGAILAGEVTAAKLSGDAIDGKTITGSTFRTSATAGTSTAPRAGLVIDTSGLRGFDASGNQTININASTGAVTIGSGATVSGYQPAGSYATTGDIANFITGSQVNANVTSITGNAITTGSINADLITTGTLVGRTIRSSTSNGRLELTNGDTIDFYFGGTKRFSISSAQQSGGAYVAAFSGGIDISSGGIYVSGSSVDLPGVYSNNTTGIDTVGIAATTNRLRRISSTQAIKYDITALTNAMSASVDSARLSTVATVDPAGILDVAVAEFSVIDDGEATDRRVLGFIADDVADKLPIAVTRDAAGAPAGVLDTSLIAALLAVVQQQQHTITELTARVEALEAK